MKLTRKLYELAVSSISELMFGGSGAALDAMEEKEVNRIFNENKKKGKCENEQDS